MPRAATSMGITTMRIIMAITVMTMVTTMITIITIIPRMGMIITTTMMSIATTTIITATAMLMTTNEPVATGALSEREAAALYRLMTWLSPSFPVGGFS